MSEWPDLPAVGELARLPLPLPPALLAAAGYRGHARYVALFWTPSGDELILSDGAVTSTGWWPAWITLIDHQLGQTILRPYTLGSSDAEAIHWLLADRHDHTLDVGAERDVRQFLATQPSEITAATEILSVDPRDEAPPATRGGRSVRGLRFFSFVPMNGCRAGVRIA
jgi:hypothetical protein